MTNLVSEIKFNGFFLPFGRAYHDRWRTFEVILKCAFGSIPLEITVSPWGDKVLLAVHNRHIVDGQFPSVFFIG
jgi:hypothetical protein